MQLNKLSLVLLLLAVAATVFASDDYESEDEVEDDKPEDRHRLRTYVESKSGRMTLSGVGTNLNESIVVEFKRLIERTSTGNEVDGSPDHEVDDFEDIDFTFEAEANVTYQGVAAKKFAFFASDLIVNGDGSSLKVEVYKFQESGIILMDEVPTAVAAGTVKWNILINDWPFCNAADNTAGIRDCDGDEGAYLDLILKIGSKNRRRREDGDDEDEFTKEIDDSDNEPRNRHFRLGATDSIVNADATLLGPALTLSSFVTLDGNLTAQPNGFPKIEGSAREQKFIFRFARAESITYDPVLSLTGATSSAFGVAANAIAVLFATLFATLALRS